MGLPPIRHFSRKPSKEDLLPFMDEKVAHNLRERFAEMEWRASIYKVSPNEFWHPEPPDGYNDDYLINNKLWRSIKRKVLKAANHRCVVCASKATLVHHRDYRPSVMSGEELQYLVAICDDCHTRVHIKPDGSTRKLSECDKVLIDAVANGWR